MAVEAACTGRASDPQADRCRQQQTLNPKHHMGCTVCQASGPHQQLHTQQQVLAANLDMCGCKLCVAGSPVNSLQHAVLAQGGVRSSLHCRLPRLPNHLL
jgi:Pyruvate/2-oxoacid:ferredoxin oxidoreductase delta subunit